MASASDGGPPANVAPERLFRVLTRTPRPMAPIECTVRWLPELFVVGLRGADVEAVHDEVAPDQARDTEAAARVVAMAVVDRAGRRVFRDVNDLAQLPATIANAIVGGSLAALATVSPIYARSPLAQWMRALDEGARHPTNSAAVGLIRLAHDVIVLPSKVVFVERPDRFYGMPLCEITDGQLMAFRAARQDMQ